MDIGSLNSFAIHTLGCKVNEYESQAIINDLNTYGINQVDFNDCADLYIINTCSVTNQADLKSRNIILRAKRRNPSAIILVAGCYSQVASKIIAEKIGAHIIIGNKYKNNIISLLEEYFATGNNLIKIDNLRLEKKFENISNTSFLSRTRAFIKIQDGCNFMCSYCIIPFTRGKQRSKDLDLILNEINQFVKNDFKEIVLTGVNTAGYEDENKNTFYDLLESILTIKGNFRIRISSVEPFQITTKIIDLITTNPQRFCNHWHICLQSGCDKILKSMNRKYSFEEFDLLIKTIRIKSPLVSISTDIIAGYPDETSEDFKTSFDNIKALNFAFLHVFPYSPRKYTSAANLDNINGLIKKERVQKLLKLSHDCKIDYLKKFINSEVEVLFEKNNEFINIGKTSEYFEVMVKHSSSLKNQLLKVKIIKILGDKMIGELIKKY